ncbi:NAD(P)-binding protein [Tothia fuscella]|uniref:NAD(P)-binding protein n=1 Tax=Tothia fuscella TaxID=1048955 RepID=A0A9P4NQG4_9PEZI|nr:NAD(P)-binding protein [Tothia fuscella]
MAVDHSNDLLVITCASGKQGSHLLPHLDKKWKRLRLVLNSSSSKERLEKAHPDADVVRADMLSAADCSRILQDASAVVYVGPSFHPREKECGLAMVDAAVAEEKKGKFQHFVFSSVCCTQLRKLLNHDCKRFVDEALMESGLNYTILQPSHFMDNTPVAMLMQQDDRYFPTGLNPAIKFSYTALRDMAEATAVVLEQREKHYFATYPIISTMPTAESELLAILGDAMGKRIRVEQKPLEEALAGLFKFLYGEKDVNPLILDGAERLLLYYNRRGLYGNPSVLEMLLGRKATSCEEWARIVVSK